MALDTHSYKIIHKKFSIENLVYEIQNWKYPSIRLFTTLDYPCLWKTSIDYLTIINLKCFLYKKSKFFYSFSDLTENEKIIIKSCFCLDLKPFIIEEWEKLVLDHTYNFGCSTNAQIGIIATNSGNLDIHNRDLFDKSTPNKYIGTEKQYNTMLSCLSVQGKKEIQFYLPSFKQGTDLIYIEH